MNRKQFIQTSATAMAAIVTGSSFGFSKKNPLLSFSTLGCPDWSFEKIIQFAAANGFKGIEIRGIQRELDLNKCNAFNTAEKIQKSMLLLRENNLSIVNLGASATMHFPIGAERTKNINDGKRFIDLANTLQCPYIRVFPNNLPKDQDKKITLDLIAAGLTELGNYAANTNVTVLMETHGDLVYTADIVYVMQQVNHAHVGLVWDMVNMWSITGEDPAMVFPQLQKDIRHTHIKDMVRNNGKDQYTFLGKGETPIFKAIDLLHKNHYKGYYSFEWEKLWHPEIAEPELAIADYASTMIAHFKG
jgi:sugar phosphate isomerase/epimerase